MQHNEGSLDLPAVRQLSINAPLKWLALGWRDFRHTPLYSSFYGLVFILMGYAVIAASWKSPILLFTFITGFLLLAPFLALGLYDLSRQGQQKQKISFIHSLLSLRHNKRDMGLLVVFHAVVMIAWVRVATIIGALYFTTSGTSVTSATTFLEQLWSSGDGMVMVALFALSGAVLAAVVFISSVVSWPMTLERDSGAISSMVTSVKVVMQNKLLMLIWASTIGVLFIIGLATLYLGLLVIMPVLGHASWHAYQELVE